MPVVEANGERLHYVREEIVEAVWHFASIDRTGAVNALLAGFLDARERWGGERS